MADFCKQCSQMIFGKDERDLAGLTTEADTKEGLYAVVICEGCGFIQVDHEGRCIGGEGCMEHHETKPKH